MNLQRSKSSNLRDTSEGSANIRRLLASRAAMAGGRRFVVFLPRETEPNNFIDIPTAGSSEAMADAERLPLWRWFISSR
jgi:hypothetical protein